MEAQVAPLAALYDLNSDLLLNCLDGCPTQRVSVASRPEGIADVRSIEDIQELGRIAFLRRQLGKSPGTPKTGGRWS